MSAQPTVHREKIAEARNVLGEVIARARFAGEPTILINRGKEAAVIVSYESYEELAVLRELRAYLAGLEGEEGATARHTARVLRESLEIATRNARLPADA